VRHPDSTKPAHEVSAEPVSGSEFLPGSKLSSNTPNASEAQAPPPDDRGESDFDYFVARPHVSTRTRLPFENEFPAGVIDAERIAFVHVVTIRDPLTNEPTTRGRGVFYCDDEGGRA
jgi:hypothetical protein